MEKKPWVKIELRSNKSDSQSFKKLPPRFESLSFSGEPVHIYTGGNFAPEMLDKIKRENEFLAGYISYSTGYNWFMKTAPSKIPQIRIPEYYLVGLKKEQVVYNQPKPNLTEKQSVEPIALVSNVNKDRYIQQVNAIKRHLQRGDIYEANYCMPYTADNVEIDPESMWEKLNKISPMPFSAFIDTDEFSIISASPERFIRKEGNRVFLQPMKGTSRKGRSEEETRQFMNELKNNRKERSENVMIVDLSRNDLSTFAKRGSVKVEELYGVYEFPTILQMVSTISCEVEDKTPGEILEATFPMGSMTGAPKHRAMQVIDQYEEFSRGPFSGILGYMDENNDFDFSVLIRTIFYDKVRKKLFLAVGSAITIGSDPEKEYEECLIKLQPLLSTLNATIE